MRHEEFRIGMECWCGGRQWRCTDVGTRVVVGVCLDPYEVVTGTHEVGTSATTVLEEIFDEHSIDGCRVSPDGDE